MTRRWFRVMDGGRSGVVSFTERKRPARIDFKRKNDPCYHHSQTMNLYIFLLGNIIYLRLYSNNCHRHVNLGAVFLGFRLNISNADCGGNMGSWGWWWALMYGVDTCLAPRCNKAVFYDKMKIIYPIDTHTVRAETHTHFHLYLEKCEAIQAIRNGNGKVKRQSVRGKQKFKMRSPMHKRTTGRKYLPYAVCVLCMHVGNAMNQSSGEEKCVYKKIWIQYLTTTCSVYLYIWYTEHECA